MSYLKKISVFFFLFVVGLTACSSERQSEFVSDHMASLERLEPAAGHMMMDYLPHVLAEKDTHSLQPQRINLNLPDEVAKPMWIQNAAKSKVGDKPKIVIVIDDLGLNPNSAARTAALPGPLTLAYLPYAHNLPAQTRLAKQNGHELMVHMPMEPNRASADPGPQALLTGMSADDLRERILHNLSAFDGYVGINNHMGSAFSVEQAGLKVLMEELRNRDLLYLDSRTIPESLAEETARRYNVTTTGRDIFLDHVISREFIEAALRRTEDHALRHGTAIAIGHPHELTLDALEAWLPTLERKGFELVPITAVMMERDPRIREVGLNYKRSVIQ